MNKEHIEKRKKELESEFEKIQRIVVQGQERMVQIQGAYAELEKLLKDLEIEDASVV